MRNGLIGLAGTMLLASSMATNGCGNSSSGGQGAAGTGGSAGTGTGGSATGGGTAGSSTAGGVPGSGGQQSNAGGSSSGSGGFTGSCPNVTPCGGDLVGTWTVTSSCLDVSGQLDVSLIGMSCPSLPVTGSLQVGGSWTAAADGSYLDGTVTTGSETFTLAPECLVISSTPTTCSGAASVIQALGYSSVVCNEKASGGCDCSATVEQPGGMGLVSYLAARDGWYTVAGSTLTTDVAPYSYCVSGNTLTLTPGATTPEVSGTIVLQNGESTGQGGAPGTGGASQGGSSSGGTGNGGQPGSGGASQGGSSSGGSNAGGTNSGGATSGGASSGGSHTGPCDIYEAANHPCVAAHSTVRALYGSYEGKLYQVRRSDDATLDISTLSPGGYADSAPQDSFCSGTTCILTVVYDQSGMGNDMWYQGSEVVPASPSSSPAKATSESLTVGGHKVYSLYIQPGNCYWRDGSQTGMPLGDAPEGMYMVTSGTHANSGCCFDYGNSETSRSADGAGTMDSINFSTTSAWGTGAGSGPWIMADLEWGLFSMGSSGMNPDDPTQSSDYVTAILKNNGTTEFALRGGNAATGPLGTYYKGSLPGGWTPMKKQGAITLGCGGDCCKPDGGANLSAGTFYEGAIVTGYPDDETEDAIQENIVEAGYGQ